MFNTRPGRRPRQDRASFSPTHSRMLPGICILNPPSPVRASFSASVHYAAVRNSEYEICSRICIAEFANAAVSLSWENGADTGRRYNGYGTWEDCVRGKGATIIISTLLCCRWQCGGCKWINRRKVVLRNGQNSVQLGVRELNKFWGGIFN